MTRLLVLLALGLVAWRYLAGRWPWERAGLANSSDAADRRLLNLPPRPSAEQIVEAHRRLVARSHPDRGGDAGETQALNAARDRLLARVRSLSREP